MASVCEKSLRGYWRKTSTQACADRYPAEIILRAYGVYLAPGGPETGAVWHGGDWALRGADKIMIQSANDRHVTYRLVEATAQSITIEDAAGCRVTYVKSTG